MYKTSTCREKLSEKINTSKYLEAVLSETLQ